MGETNNLDICERALGVGKHVVTCPRWKLIPPFQEDLKWVTCKYGDKCGKPTCDKIHAFVFDGPPPAEGTKNDQGKLRYDLLAPEALEGLVGVLTYGATKYAPRNWERGISYSRVFAAAMRHLWAWFRGNECDPETGLSHLDHAACCIHFLSAYTKRKMTAFDDRPKQEVK